MAKRAKSASTRFGSPGVLAERYALAFYQYLEQQGGLKAALVEAGALLDALQETPALSALLTDGALSKAKSMQIIENLLEKLDFSRAFRNFVGVVVGNGRLAFLPRMLTAFQILADRRENIVPVEITTPMQLTGEEREALLARLREMGCENPRLREKTDPALLGGMTLRVGSMLYDTSFRGRLVRLRHMKGEA